MDNLRKVDNSKASRQAGKQASKGESEWANADLHPNLVGEQLHQDGRDHRRPVAAWGAVTNS